MCGVFYVDDDTMREIEKNRQKLSGKLYGCEADIL